jgi:hypothetical protein
MKNEEREMKMSIDSYSNVILPSIKEIASKFIKGLEGVEGSVTFMRSFSLSLQSNFE